MQDSSVIEVYGTYTPPDVDLEVELTTIVQAYKKIKSLVSEYKTYLITNKLFHIKFSSFKC